MQVERSLSLIETPPQERPTYSWSTDRVLSKNHSLKLAETDVEAGDLLLPVPFCLVLTSYDSMIFCMAPLF